MAKTQWMRWTGFAALACSAWPIHAASLVLDHEPIVELTRAGSVYAVTTLGDGSVLVAGDLDRYGSLVRRRIGRLRPDGEADPGFAIDCAYANDAGGPRSLPCSIGSLQALDDGRIVIAGWLSRVGGMHRAGIARVLADGSIDPDWNPPLQDDGYARVVATHGDWLLVTNNEQKLRRIGLAAPGIVDAAFAPDLAVFAAAVDIRGQVFVGANVLQQLVRLDPTDGSVDSFWTSGLPHPSSLHVAYDASVDRLFAVYRDASSGSRVRVARLHPLEAPALESGWSLRTAGADGPQPIDFAWIQSLIARAGILVVTGATTAESPPRIWTFDTATGMQIASTSSAGHDILEAIAVDSAGRVLTSVATADRTDTQSPRGSSLLRLDSQLQIDGSFPSRTRHSATVVRAATHEDGSIAIAGGFSRVGDTPRDGLARFDRTLRLMPDWRAPTAIVGEEDFIRALGLAVTDLAFDTDGRLIVAGVSASSPYQYLLYRLDATTGRAGGPWASFASATYDGPLVLQSTNAGTGMFVGGFGLRRLCGAPADSIVRLLTDGACVADPSFGINADGWIEALALAADGNLYVGGQFARIAGNDLPRLARLSAIDGRIDGGWRPAPTTMPTDASFTIAVGPAAVYIGGPLASVAALPVRGLARIGLTSATADPFWRPLGADAANAALLVESHGEVIAAWSSEPASAGGSVQRTIAALPAQAPASVGSVLVATLGYGYAEQLLPLGEGRVLWTGDFSSVDGNHRTGIALLRTGTAAVPFADGFESLTRAP